MAKDCDLAATKQNLSIKEMAERLQLSRSRLDQLLASGIFAPPIRDARSGRPYFDREATEKNLSIRRTGVGLNGQPVLFYSPRARTATTATPRRRRAQQTGDLNAQHDELVAALSSLDLGNVTQREISEAFEALYRPGSLPPDTRAVYRFLKQKRASDS